MKKTIWDILFWIGMLLLLLFITAKLFGWINTPDWINLLPLATLWFIIGTFYQKVNEFANRMYVRTDFLKNKLEEHSKRLTILEEKL